MITSLPQGRECPFGCNINSVLDSALYAVLDSVLYDYFVFPGALATTTFILRKISRRRSRGQPKLRRT